MVSSKEILVILRLLAGLNADEKANLINFLCVRQDNEDNLAPHAFSREKVAE